ncbi:cysteine peptidase B (CPB) [Leishmania donovani]|uniref:Cysteine peptidase B (CPB) n=2 Tax=Leishmania donovani TaxID=5661 RepID=E9B953_LEIDO|nr:cysteine peptidase B (CPB) [Leishmania donovani]CBZ31776.1 cysteine peptidase B (CPB) [Leishmania donovani]
MPSVSIRADPVGEDQIFVLRILSLTSRRAAAVKDRAKAAAAAATPSGLSKKFSHPSLSSSFERSGAGGTLSKRGSPESTAGACDSDGAGALVMGTALLTESADEGATTTSHSHASHMLHAPGGCIERECGVESAEAPLLASAVSPTAKGEMTNPADAPESPLLATSPISAMRRAMEKGARPVRRPRTTPASSPFARTRSGSSGDPSEAAKAAALRRDAVRRTLSLLGLPTSAGVSAGLDRYEVAAPSSSQAPGGGAGVDEHALTTTVSPVSAGGRSGSARAPEASRSPAVSAPATPVESTQGKSDAGCPGSPVVVKTFGAFLQLLQPAPPPPSLVVPLPGPKTASAAPRSTMRDNVAGSGQPSFTTPPPPQPQLSLPIDSAFRSVPSLPPPPTPPPPYVATPVPQATFGAGTFTTAQDLVAHVRLLLPWTVVAAKRRRRMLGGADEFANDLALSPLSSSWRPIPAASERATSANSPSSAQSPQRRVLSTDSAATTNSSSFMDDEVTLVSDRVDAVLPTWAYLSSHIADAAPPTLVLSVPTFALARDDSLTMTSTGSGRHRRTHSPQSSTASSVVGGVPPPLLSMAAAPLIMDERTDRQSCLYPYELAEACALARLRRPKSKTAAAAASARSSLHLLRLELQVDVQHIPPTVRNVAPAQRQCILDQALTEFTLTGVLSTTVLRGVLNDAALRLLASVDDEVLRRIAGEVDQASQAEVEPCEGGTSSVSAVPAVTDQAGRQRVVPLSLQVHALQGEPGIAAGATAGPLLSSTSVHSATTSTVSGETDSPRHMPMVPTVTPTRLVLMVLVHVQHTATTLAAPEAQETPRVHGEQRPQPKGHDRERAAETVEASSSSSAADAATRMDENAAVSLASAVVPHLFPLTFGLSRFTTRLSLSSAVDYDALCTATRTSDTESWPSSAAEAAEEVAAASAETSGRRAAEFSEGSTATTTEEGTRITGAEAAAQPWSWQDISVGSVRAWCGLPELKPPPTPAAVAPFSSSPLAFSRVVSPMAVGAGGTASMSASLSSQPTPKRQWPLQKMVPEAATAVVPESEAVRDAAADQAVALEREAKGQLGLEGKEEGELDDSGAISETLRRCDVGKETVVLTSVVEAVHRCVDALCGHARLLRALMETGEAEVEAGEASNGVIGCWGSENEGKLQEETPAGQQCTVAFAETGCTSKADAAHGCRCVDDHAYLQDIMAATQQVLVCGLTRLLIVGLSVPEPAKGSEVPVSAESAAACDAEKRSAGSRSVLFSMLASAEDSDGNAAARTCGISQQLRRWFSVYGRYLAERLCAPLEQLEAFIAETTGSAAATPKTAKAISGIFENGHKSLSDVPSTSRRVVLGAQVMVKEKRRHRRHTAGVKASQDGAKWDGAAKSEEADAYAVDSSVLPALSIAKATVQLCRTMAGTLPPLYDAGTVASCKEPSSLQHTPTTSTDGDGLATMSNTASLSQPHCRQHYRSTSRTLSASMRTAGATAGAVHPLHERVAPLIDALTSVLRLFEAEERRWAALQEPLACLRGHWRDMRAIINEECVQRCEVGQSSLVALERQMRDTLAMREVRGWSSIVAEEVAAAAPAVALAAEGESSSAEPAELGELTVPASQPRTSSQRSVAQKPTLTPIVTLPLMPDLSSAHLPPTHSLKVLQRTVIMAEACKGERAAAGSDEHVEVAVEETLLSPSPPTPSHASDVESEEPEAAEEGELKHACAEDVVMAEDSEAGESGDDGIEAAAEKLNNRPTASAEAAAPPLSPLLSAATSSHLATTLMQQHRPQRNQPKQSGRAKRSGQAPMTQPHSQTQSHAKAAGSRAQASKSSATPPISLQNSRAPPAASNSTARPSQQRGTASADYGAGAAASVWGALALAVRQVQRRSTAAPLYLDVVVLRQATPFVAVGAVLFFLLLFL